MRTRYCRTRRPFTNWWTTFEIRSSEGTPFQCAFFWMSSQSSFERLILTCCLFRFALLRTSGMPKARLPKMEQSATYPSRKIQTRFAPPCQIYSFSCLPPQYMRTAWVGYFFRFYMLAQECSSERRDRQNHVFSSIFTSTSLSNARNSLIACT